MNILHVTAQRPDSTGSGVYLRETVLALDRAGHGQAVIAGVGPNDASPFPDCILFAPVRFETPARPFSVVGMSDVMPYPATRYRDLTPRATAQFEAAFEHAFDDLFSRFAPDVVICHHLYLVLGVLMRWMDAHPDVRGRCSVRGVSHNTDLPEVRYWFSEYAPDAPIWYVDLPQFAGADPASGPTAHGSIAFERNLARALETALRAPAAPAHLDGLSWKALADRLIAP